MSQDLTEYFPMVSASQHFKRTLETKRAEAERKANGPIRSETLGTLTWAVPQLARFASGNAKRTTSGNEIIADYRLVTSEVVWHYFRTTEAKRPGNLARGKGISETKDRNFRVSTGNSEKREAIRASQSLKRGFSPLSSTQVHKRAKRAKRGKVARSKALQALASKPTKREAETTRLQLTPAEAEAERQYVPGIREDTFPITAEFSEAERKAEQAKRWKRNAERLAELEARL